MCMEYLVRVDNHLESVLAPDLFPLLPLTSSVTLKGLLQLLISRFLYP